MGDCDLGSFLVAEQHRQAISGQNRTHDARSCGNTAVCLRRSFSIDHVDDPSPMDLGKPDWLRRQSQGLSEPSAVCSDRLGVVADALPLEYGLAVPPR